MKKWVGGFLSFMVLMSMYGQNVRTVAVLDFKNLSQQSGYDFLASALAESFVSVFSKNASLRVVERQQLITIIQEQKLVLTGLVENDISNSIRIGALVAAEYLLLGSYTVTKEGVEVNARLVDVSSGVVAAAERGKAQLGDALFALAQEMAQQIQGKKILSTQDCIALWTSGMSGQSGNVSYTDFKDYPALQNSPPPLISGHTYYWAVWGYNDEMEVTHSSAAISFVAP